MNKALIRLSVGINALNHTEDSLIHILILPFFPSSYLVNHRIKSILNHFPLHRLLLLVTHSKSSQTVAPLSPEQHEANLAVIDKTHKKEKHTDKSSTAEPEEDAVEQHFAVNSD